MDRKLLGTDEDITEIDYEDDTALQGDIDAQLESVIGEFAGENDLNGLIKIYQVRKGAGKMDWCFDCLPDELPILERVRDEFGPGDYVSRFYLGKNLKRAFKFSIATPRLSQIPENKSQNSGDVSVLADVIQRSMDSMKELIVQNNAPQAQPTMMEMQTQIMTQMAAMKEMFGGGQNNSPIKDLKDMMSLVEDLRGEKKDVEPKGIMDVMGSLIDKALPVLSQAAETSENNRQITQQPGRKNNPQNKENNAMDLAMKMKLKFLCTMAAKNADPSTYAGLIIDQSDDNQLSQLVQFIEENNWMENLSKIHPDVNNYPAWFNSLKDELMGELFPPVDEGVDIQESSTDTQDINNVDNSGITSNDVHLSGGETPANKNNDNP